eukprot:scaffold91800_cov14-Tisochrysis_lutea.AAC.1
MAVCQTLKMCLWVVPCRPTLACVLGLVLRNASWSQGQDQVQHPSLLLPAFWNPLILTESFNLRVQTSTLQPLAPSWTPHPNSSSIHSLVIPRRSLTGPACWSTTGGIRDGTGTLTGQGAPPDPSKPMGRLLDL